MATITENASGVIVGLTSRGEHALVDEDDEDDEQDRVEVVAAANEITNAGTERIEDVHSPYCVFLIAVWEGK